MVGSVQHDSVAGVVSDFTSDHSEQITWGVFRHSTIW